MKLENRFERRREIGSAKRDGSVSGGKWSRGERQ